MVQIHIRKEPVWYGDRSQMCVGIARFRLMHNGQPRKGDVRVWIDTVDGNGQLYYAYPYQMPCVEALKYPTMTVWKNGKPTTLHMVQLAHMRIVKTRRKRKMIQDEFKNIVNEAVKQGG